MSLVSVCKDLEGHFYCLTDQGAVHHVELGELEEALSAEVERPETAGKRAADSVVQFVMSLRLPDWVVAHLRDSGEADKNLEAPRSRGRTGRSGTSAGAAATATATETTETER